MEETTFLFVEHEEAPATDKAHCDCEVSVSTVTDKPHCGECG